MPDNAFARVTELRAPTSGGGIPAVSWVRVAMAIGTARQSNATAIVVEFADGPPLGIDLERHEFVWEGLDGPVPASVSVQRVLLHSTPVEGTASGHDLDPLLWWIGLTAFEAEPAGWLAPDSRVRLAGWPNLTVLDHTPEQMRMIAALGSTYLTAAELARSTGGATDDAQRLVNALSLMDLVVSALIAETPTPDLPPLNRGLFRRLRDRLGI